MSRQDLTAPAAPSEAAPNSVFLLIAAALALLGLAVYVWGLPALAMTALAAVPVIFTLLMAVTRG